MFTVKRRTYPNGSVEFGVFDQHAESWFDYLFIARADGQLTEDQLHQRAQGVRDFLAQHPDCIYAESFA